MKNKWCLLIIVFFFFLSGFKFLKEPSIVFTEESFSPDTSGKIKISGMIEGVSDGSYPANINYQKTRLKLTKGGHFTFYIDADDLVLDKLNIGVDIQQNILVNNVDINLEKYKKVKEIEFKRNLINELMILFRNEGLSLLSQQDGVDKKLIPGLNVVPLASSTVVIDNSDNSVRSMRIFVMRNDEDYAKLKNYFLFDTNYNFNPVNMDSFQLRLKSRLLSYDEKISDVQKKISEAKKIYPLAYSGVAYNDTLNLFVQFDTDVRFSVINPYKSVIMDEDLLLNSGEYSGIFQGEKK